MACSYHINNITVRYISYQYPNSKKLHFDLTSFSNTKWLANSILTTPQLGASNLIRQK